MVLVTQNDMGGLGPAIGNIGNIVGQALERRNLNQRSQKSGDLIQQALMEASIDPETGQRIEPTDMGLISALAKAQSQGAFPEDIKSFGTLMSTLGKKSQQAKQPTFFQKEFQKGIAKQIIDTSQEIGKLASAESNLNAIEQLVPEVSGPKGYFPTGAAKELNARGLAAIEPVIKIFNPRGVIPQQKIEMVKGLFAPKASDLVTTIEAKVKALRSFNEKAQEHAQDFLDLVNTYGEDIPLQELTKYEKRSNKIIDETVANFRKGNTDGEIEEKEELSSIPPPSKHSGRIIRDTASGKRFKSNGKRWREIK